MTSPGREVVEPAPAAPRPPAPRLGRSAGLIGSATMASRVLGLVREQVMAYLFGAGNAVDAFNVAFRIPNLVRDLFAEGAMSAAFVPTFTRYLGRHGRPAAWRLGNHVVNALVVVTGLLVVLGMVFAAPLVGVLAGDYAQVPGKFELTVQLTRIMLPFLTLVALAAAFMGMLNSLDRYFVPALAPAMFNVGSILCTIALVPVMMRLGWPAIHAMAIGVLVGGLCQLLLQWPLLLREGFAYRPALDPSEPGLRQVLFLMGPGTLGLAATQVNVFVNTWLATGEGTGAVSWLSYAFRLMYLPLGVFGVSIATAALPAISRRVADQDVDGLRQTVTSGLGMMLALNVPATLGLIVLSQPIVALLFERGAFTAADTEATAGALVYYAIGLTGYAVVKIVSPTFYALHESRVPVAVSVLSVLTNAALNIAFVRWFGYRGLALGTSLTALMNAGLLLFLLHRRIDGLGIGRLAGVFARVLVASAGMAAAAWFLHAEALRFLPGSGLVFSSLRVGAAIAGALVVLAGLSWLLRIEEFTGVADALAARLTGRRRR
jgi:putative peptidoglycan lipid II flippase